MKPFIKWVGGKGKLLSQLLPLFPKKIRTYYEPFIGGGAVFFSLAEEKRFERAVINDWNADLVNTYKTVRDFPEDLLSALADLQSSYKTDPASLFEYWRRPNETLKKLLEDSPLFRACRFIFLNKTAFNGLYRVNKKGEFNAPWGKYENPKIHDEPTLRACSTALAEFVTILRGDFEAAVQDAREGDCVYFDPPYVPLNVTSSFTSYTSEGFGKEEQERLARVVRDLMSRGVSVLVSNSSAPLVRDLYKGLEIQEIDAPRAINSKGGGRGKIKELVVLGRSELIYDDSPPKPHVVEMTIRRDRKDTVPEDWHQHVLSMEGVTMISVDDGILQVYATTEALCRLQAGFGSFVRVNLPVPHVPA